MHRTCPEEGGREERFRRGVELFARAYLKQPPAFQNADAVGKLERLLLVVSDKDSRHAKAALNLFEAAP